jgi:hypothetical protein
MTPTAIIQRAAAEEVTLSLTPTGSIKASGDKAAVNRWLPTIREHKAELLTALQLVPVPGEIQALIDRVMRALDCQESDRHAFAQDWCDDPTGADSALRHLDDYYGGDHGK